MSFIVNKHQFKDEPQTNEMIYKNAAIREQMKSCILAWLAANWVVLGFFVPFLNMSSCVLTILEQVCRIHHTQVGASSYHFTTNQSIPPARPLFNLYLFSPFPFSPTSLTAVKRSQTMDGNESNAHCAPCAGKSDWLTEGSDCKIPTPATSAMNGLNHWWLGHYHQLPSWRFTLTSWFL